jgi:hypothetical protein
MKNGIMHPAVFADDMLFTNISFRSGSKHFYSILSAGVGGGATFGSGDKLLVARAGFGFEYSVNKLFMNIDVTSGNIINIDTFGDKKDDDKSKWDKYGSSVSSLAQLRLLAGYKFLPHLGIFAGVSYDYIQRDHDTSPNPRDFGGLFLGEGFKNDRNIHKLGLFGGIQF